MTKIKNKLLDSLFALFGRRSVNFSNIAEGTHAGSITMIAGEQIENSNLLVKAGALESEVLIAGASDKPIGVVCDEGSKGEAVSVYLPGSAESTFICATSSDVSAGDSLYTSANGKVSAIAGDGSRKVGVALCSAATGGVVEIDPQGFGERAWQICACGVFEWIGSASSANLASAEISASDSVFATIAATGGSEKSVRAVANEGSIHFSLDSAGSEGTTKIYWMAIRKN